MYHNDMSKDSKLLCLLYIYIYLKGNQILSILILQSEKKNLLTQTFFRVTFEIIMNNNTKIDYRQTFIY